ncbi:MAG: bifunctional 4-hydroxy-2-oxoglutarate aldolase/2-dehydro-3-deoxy-phosphogluconate aldolase [Sphaerochaetaceae bacterium]
MDVLETIRSYGIIPVLGLKNPGTAQQLADALSRGGLPLVEVTLRNQGALECIKAIKSNNKSMLVGAGTVLSCEQVDLAKEAGVDFIVTPGFNPKVVKYCLTLGLPVTPGCTTPSEIEIGLELGLSTFKFFPAEALGGLEMIQQLCGPYQNVHFICTGGMNFNNIGRYLANDKIVAVGGSFVAPNPMIDACDWTEITALCEKAINISLGFSIAHIGLNGTNKEEGLMTAKWFADRFGFPVKIGEQSNFAGTAVECGNTKFPGKYGHIGFFTNSPERAVAYFARNGVPLRDEFKSVDANGNIIAVYLAEEIGGFAVHIVKNKNTGRGD